jgi:hypothetical protein
LWDGREKASFPAQTGRRNRPLTAIRRPGLEMNTTNCHISAIGSPTRESGRFRAACKTISALESATIFSPVFRSSSTALTTRDV